MSTHIEVLPRSRIVKVELALVLPCAATRDEIEAWVAYEVMQSGSCRSNNPLLNKHVEFIGEPLLTDTELHQHVSVERAPLQEGDREGMRRFWISRRRLHEPYHGPSYDEQMHAFHKEDMPEYFGGDDAQA